MYKHFHSILFLACFTVFFSACQSTQPALEGASAEEAPAADSATSQSISSSEIVAPQDLISKEDAESILGESVLDCVPSDNAVVGQKLCFYDAADENSNRFLQIAITQQAFMPSDNPNTPQSIYDGTKETFGEGAVMIDGIGDEAILISGGYYVMSDGYLLQISAGNTDDEAVLAILDQAGRLAVANLKSILGK